MSKVGTRTVKISSTVPQRWSTRRAGALHPERVHAGHLRPDCRLARVFLRPRSGPAGPLGDVRARSGPGHHHRVQYQQLRLALFDQSGAAFEREEFPVPGPRREYQVGDQGDDDPVEADGPTGEQDDQCGGTRAVRPAVDPREGLQAALLHPQLRILPLSRGAEGGRPSFSHFRYGKK